MFHFLNMGQKGHSAENVPWSQGVLSSDGPLKAGHTEYSEWDLSVQQASTVRNRTNNPQVTLKFYLNPAYGWVLGWSYMS